MIPVPAQTIANGAVRVWLATGRTDMRNYVERVIMRSSPVGLLVLQFLSTS